MSSFKTAKASWKSIYGPKPGTEIAVFRRQSVEGVLSQYTSFNIPFKVGYHFFWNSDFQVTKAVLEVSFEGRSRKLTLEKANSWSASEPIDPLAANCEDIDLWPSPMTNSITIRRLKLKIGESKKISVLYVEAPQLLTRVDEQTYTHLQKNTYRFESPNFKADITVDDDGLVVNYPDYFIREKI